MLLRYRPLGKVFTGSFIYRYAICTVIGCSMLIGIASTLAGQDRRRVPIVLVSAFFAWFMANGLHKPKSMPKESVPEAAMMDDKLPIVISSPLEFVKLFHYAPPDVASRLYYLTDVNTASKMPDFVPEMALNA